MSFRDRSAKPLALRDDMLVQSLSLCCIGNNTAVKNLVQQKNSPLLWEG